MKQVAGILVDDALVFDRIDYFGKVILGNGILFFGIPILGEEPDDLDDDPNYWVEENIEEYRKITKTLYKKNEETSIKLLLLFYNYFSY